MYYKHSGRFSLGGLILGLANLGGVGALAARLYLRARDYSHSGSSPRGLRDLAFGGLVGLATGWGMVWGKVRNRRSTPPSLLSPPLLPCT